jgi:hypothetical protein
MPPHSNLLDFAFDVIETEEDFSASISIDLDFLLGHRTNQTTMPPHSNLVDFAFDVDFNKNALISSAISFSDSFRINPDFLVSAASKQPKKAKSVRFGQYDEVEEITHISDFSQEEVDSLWFSRKEQSAIRRTCFSLVNRFNAGEVMDKDEMRGLEIQTKAVADPADRLRRAVNKVVFSLQEEAEHVTSLAARTSLIADLYEKRCAKSALEARLSALKLTMEVKNDTEISLS